MHGTWPADAAGWDRRALERAAEGHREQDSSR